jgi:pimeloyl-ACP methyl ester carboxylesterase
VSPLVLLPGMGCSPDLWSGLALGTEPVTPVLEEPDLDLEVDRLLDVLPDRFALAGLSLGAIVAMALVRRAPERVERLALLSTNPYPPTEAQLTGWEEQRRALATGGRRALQTGLLPSLLSPAVLTGRPDLVERALTMAEEVGEARYDAQLRLQATRVDERPGLRAVRCPTLVLAARQDRLCRVERHEEIAALVPGAELVVVDDCAHLSPLERPAAVSGHLGRWLGRAAV